MPELLAYEEGDPPRVEKPLGPRLRGRVNPIVGTVFPNFLAAARHLPRTFRVWHPARPDKTEPRLVLGDSPTSGPAHVKGGEFRLAGCAASSPYGHLRAVMTWTMAGNAPAPVAA